MPVYEVMVWGRTAHCRGLAAAVLCYVHLWLLGAATPEAPTADDLTEPRPEPDLEETACTNRTSLT